MRVLVVGGGGREHALVHSFVQSSLAPQVFCAPGNAGIAAEADCVPIGADDVLALLEFALKERPDLTVIGPEAPLVAGVTDVFRERGLLVFGPDARAARMEGSKVFAKEVMGEAGAPTGGYSKHIDRRVGARRARPPDRLPGRRQGRRPRRRQGRDHRQGRGRGARRGRGHARGEVVRRRRRGRRRRGAPRRQRGLAARPLRRRDRRAPRPRPGLQAHLRRRPGPEHRRHGELLPRPRLRAAAPSTRRWSRSSSPSSRR